ncbi:MAG TPA: PQQ-binding-like beta-propeller repeat protein, partial [Vicinamibacteria bacterium]
MTPRLLAAAAAASLLATTPLAAQSLAPDLAAGKRHFETLCARCHGGDGNGGEMGPAIVGRLSARNDDDLAHLIHAGLPAAGMPPFPIAAEDTRALVAYLRTLRSDDVTPPKRVDLRLADGGRLSGVLVNETAHDVQLLADDRRLHLLRRTGDTYRRVTSDVDWPTYHGHYSGNRFTTLDQITKDNVARLAPRWTYSLGATSRLQVTPVVVDGVMYVTTGNECHALDAGSGRLLWQYRRPRQKDIPGDAGGGINRGVAVAGGRVFMVTTHAHLIALDRATGALLWDTEMADWRKNYGATSAPL